MCVYSDYRPNNFGKLIFYCKLSTECGGHIILKCGQHLAKIWTVIYSEISLDMDNEKVESFLRHSGVYVYVDICSITVTERIITLISVVTIQYRNRL